jgi:multidrug efflux pump subunit AcrA (membrane-fusion protein)
MSNEIIKVDGLTETLQSLPAQLESHKLRVSKAEAVASKLLTELEEAGGEVTEDLDLRANNFLANCNKARKELSEARKPFTQVMDQVKKVFTAEENKLDPAAGGFAGEIQKMRDTRAKQLYEKQQQEKAEAERKAALIRVKAEAEAKMSTHIRTVFSNLITTRKSQMQNSFDAITLETFEKKSAGLKSMSTAFKDEDVEKVLGDVKATLTMMPLGLTNTDQLEILKKVIAEFDVMLWKSEFAKEIEIKKMALIDQLNTKRETLEQLAKADDEMKARIADREAYEKKKQEEEQAAEQAAALKKLEQEAEQKKSQVIGESMFEQAVAATPTEAMPETRASVEIVVVHHVGWTELFQLWFTMAGATMPLDKMGAVKLDGIKAFAEALAKDGGTRIDSPNLRYETKVKAVNRKTK